MVMMGPTMDEGPLATDVHPPCRGLSCSCVMGTSGGSGLAGELSTWCVVTSLLLVELEAFESRAFMTAASLMTLLNSRSAARSLLLPWAMVFITCCCVVVVAVVVVVAANASPVVVAVCPQVGPPAVIPPRGE